MEQRLDLPFQGKIVRLRTAPGFTYTGEVIKELYDVVYVDDKRDGVVIVYKRSISDIKILKDKETIHGWTQ